jgi:hypothetical protein
VLLFRFGKHRNFTGRAELTEITAALAQSSLPEAVSASIKRRMSMLKKIALGLPSATVIASQVFARSTFHEGYYYDAEKGCMFQGYPCGEWNQI